MIHASIADKLAQKFEKKANFSHESVVTNLSKKEQKLSLEKLCRKYVKRNEAEFGEACEASTRKRKYKGGIADEKTDLTMLPKSKKEKV